MRRDVDAAVVATATRQHNAFSRQQAYDRGADWQTVRRRVATGLWQPAAPDVFTLAGAVDPWRQRLWVAHLACGPDSTLSFETAGQVHGYEGVRHGHVVLTVSHAWHHRIEGAFVHQLNDVRPHHVQMWEALPVTTPVRTLLDLAAVLNVHRLRAAIQSAIVKRQTSFSEIDRLRRELTRRGKPGMRKLVAVLDQMAGDPVPESVLERWLLAAAKRAGIAVRPQHPLPWTREPVKGLTDATTLDAKLIFEADGRAWHARYTAMARDRRRDVEAAKAGYQTLRFVHEDLSRDIEGVARDMRTVYDQRLALLRHAS